MALSNYDILSINHNSESINGVLTSKIGIQVEIYKNWLYVHDTVAWQKEIAYTHPCIMKIQNGNLTYKNVQIYAERGPQGGIYCIAITPLWPNKDKKEKLNVMVGIGCYGYIDDKFVGVQSKSVDFLIDMIKRNKNTFPRSYNKILENLNFKEGIRFNQGDAYFAENLNFDTPASQVEKATTPIILNMC